MIGTIDTNIYQQKSLNIETRWKQRTRMYSRSWTTSANLCNRKTNLCLHASCGSQRDKYPAQQHHHKHNEITTSTTISPAQCNHNKMTKTTASPAQQHHQHNEITTTCHTPHFTHCTLHTPHFTLHTPHTTLYTPQSTLYTLHFTLYT